LRVFCRPKVTFLPALESSNSPWIPYPKRNLESHRFGIRKQLEWESSNPRWMAWFLRCKYATFSSSLQNAVFIDVLPPQMSLKIKLGFESKILVKYARMLNCPGV
jgi:hypothetical protein